MVGAVLGLNRKQVARLFEAISDLLRDEGDEIISLPGAPMPRANPDGSQPWPEKARTATVRSVAVHDGLALPALANDAEESKIAVLLDQLPTDRLREYAVFAAVVDPRNYARELDDGILGAALIDALKRFVAEPPVEIKTPALYVALHADRDYLIDCLGYGKGAWGAALASPHEQGDSEDDGRSGTLRRPFGNRVALYLIPITSSYAAAPREGSEEPENRGATAGGDSASAPGRAGELGSLRSPGIEGETSPLGELPESVAALARIFGEGEPPPKIAQALTWTLRRLSHANDGEPLTGEQREAVDAALSHQLRERAAGAEAEGRRGSFRIALAALKYLRGDDLLFQRIKGLRSDAEDSDLGDLLSGIGD